MTKLTKTELNELQKHINNLGYEGLKWTKEDGKWKREVLNHEKELITWAEQQKQKWIEQGRKETEDKIKKEINKWIKEFRKQTRELIKSQVKQYFMPAEMYDEFLKTGGDDHGFIPVAVK